jgi:predicted ATPase/class 3 adenylate cyclase
VTTEEGLAKARRRAIVRRVAELPRGTVTTLFTDVEGSTRLLQRLGTDAYREQLELHRELLRAAFARHGGREVEMQGDSFHVVFARASDAVAAAADLQRALSEAKWPYREPIRVRVGIHTGEPQAAGDLFVGLDIHRAARVMAAGHGGQVLASETTAALVGNDLPSGLGLRDLGLHRLKDFDEPQRLYQLGDRVFPPLKTLYHTNLPLSATPFLGRERELREVSELLSRDDVRLLTLTGPGGTGKTRLALQAAADAADGYPDGVFWVPLAALRDPELVLETAAQALGAKEGLHKHLADRRVLILLDNFEQLVEASPIIAALLSACPGVDLLVTSRERLQLKAEHEWPVPPLERADAVTLFTQRADAVGVYVAANGTVGELCARLDDLPLAVELAAARAKLFSPQQLLDRLSQRLDLLKGLRDADPRQQTLRATIQWSYDLLTAEENTLFARLAVFAGGCTFEAAEEVCEADLDTLAALLDKSLLRKRGERVFMLETLRDFALERLEASREAEALQRRHAQYFRDLVEIDSGTLEAAEEVWHDPLHFALLEEEQNNLRAALTWSIERREANIALRLVWDLWHFWATQGYLSEGRKWAELALAQGADAPISLRVWAVLGTSELARYEPDLRRATALKEEAIGMLRALEDDGTWSAALLADLAHIAADTGDYERGEQLAAEAFALQQQLGRNVGLAHALDASARLAVAKGEYRRAVALNEEVLAIFQAADDPYRTAEALRSLGNSLRHTGDAARAESVFREALLASFDVGVTSVVGECIEGLAQLAAADGQYDRASRLWGAATELRIKSGAEHFDAAEHEASVSSARTQLGEETFEAATAEGKAMSLEDAVAYARQ